ncbi:hypothetical protein BDN72DRAFT_966093 [Pluteus cervinus]|uniref:Uncharacterized protein n=1 Tax=Pluteus cervinus TaxID=181527 RepID=A0ACD3A0I6_9AGAR|nr:hypothetical protein BDN72DRAFT_966093 [Pluteus cervinus]
MLTLLKNSLWDTRDSSLAQALFHWDLPSTPSEVTSQSTAVTDDHLSGESDGSDVDICSDEQLHEELSRDVMKMYEEVFIATPEWLDDFLHVCSSPTHRGSFESARFSPGEVVYQYIPQRDIRVRRFGRVYPPFIKPRGWVKYRHSKCLSLSAARDLVDRDFTGLDYFGIKDDVWCKWVWDVMDTLNRGD